MVRGDRSQKVVQKELSYPVSWISPNGERGQKLIELSNVEERFSRWISPNGERGQKS